MKNEQAHLEKQNPVLSQLQEDPADAAALLTEGQVENLVIQGRRPLPFGEVKTTNNQGEIVIFYRYQLTPSSLTDEQIKNISFKADGTLVINLKDGSQTTGLVYLLTADQKAALEQRVIQVKEALRPEIKPANFRTLDELKDTLNNLSEANKNRGLVFIDQVFTYLKKQVAEVVEESNTSMLTDRVIADILVYLFYKNQVYGEGVLDLQGATYGKPAKTLQILSDPDKFREYQQLRDSDSFKQAKEDASQSP